MGLAQKIACKEQAPNAHARLLDGSARIEKIVNNYGKISFDFGPTLLGWMKDQAADIHQAVIDADQQSQRQFSGHGAALAQCYNHMILPLANRRDKETQVRWGIRDFELRFGRKPEGMWLPETAADDESLDILAAHGIKFTVLSPFQARQTRPLDRKEWQEVNGGQVDSSIPFLVRLASGRSLAVFFYDHAISKEVAFDQLLNNGGSLAERLTGAFDPARNAPQIISIATDGESYGHHFHSGEMALAYALRTIEQEGKAHLTVYAEFLEKYPPEQEVRIHQGSAWSCPHGVDRWRRDCGCNSGGRPGWNQRWREPLRNALDWLRDKLAPFYETKAGEMLKDPWAARDDYLDVILDRSRRRVDSFFERHSCRPLDESERSNALRLLETQRHALLMYTSCGWFFDDLSGIETVQVIQYAARAIQLARILGEDLEEGFLQILGGAESNLPDPHDGRQIYDRYVRPAVMTREGAAAHYAINSLFEYYDVEARVHSFTMRQEDRQSWTAGKARLAVGRIKLTSEIIQNSDQLTYAVFHSGDHTINAAVKESSRADDYAKLIQETRAAFDHGDFPDLIRLMDRHFGPVHYTVERLFRDEQRKVLDQILAGPGDEVYNALRGIIERCAPLMRFLAEIHAPPPKSLGTAAEIVFNAELLRRLAEDTLDLAKMRELLAECASRKVTLNHEELAYALKAHCDRAGNAFQCSVRDIDCLRRFVDAAELARSVPFQTQLWKPQNIYFGLATTVLPKMRRRSREGSENAAEWVGLFLALGERLGFVPICGVSEGQP